MASLNKVILIGHMTADPELKQTPSGLSVCSFSIGISRRYTKAGEQAQSDFINIVAWRTLAENCNKYLTKGSKVCVVGRLQNRTYEDKDGNKRYATDIVAEDVEFISRAGSGAEQGESVPASKPKTNGAKGGVTIEPADDDDTLPF